MVWSIADNIDGVDNEILLKISLQHTLSLTFLQNISTSVLNSVMCHLASMILY